MTNWRTKAAIFVMIGALVLTFSLITAWAMPDGSAFISEKGKDIGFDFNDLHVDIPADATDEIMTVDYDNADLSGINLPYGFQMVGKPYRFGPHGIQFKSGKELRIRLKIDNTNLPLGYGLNSVSLFYINRENHCLMKVPDQNIDRNGNLNAKMTHFSSYTLGVSSNWNGDGIYGNLDYVHDGIEYLSMYRLIKSVRYPVLSLTGRGGLKLTACFSEGRSDNEYLDPLYISGGWHWDLPHVGWILNSVGRDNTLYMPGGASFSVDSTAGGETGPANGTGYKFFGDEKVALTYTNGALTKVTFKDGSFLTIGTTYQTYTDGNGNLMRYDFTGFGWDGARGFYRMSSITDSAGRKFYFDYNKTDPLWNEPYTVTLKKVEQEAQGYPNSRKTILSIDGLKFTDAAERSTIFKETKVLIAGMSPQIFKFYLDGVIYPNGTRSEYKPDPNNYAWYLRNWYYPNHSTPYRTEKYFPIFVDLPFQEYGGMSAMIGLIFIDGTRGRKFNFTCHALGTGDLDGYTYNEDTYELSNGDFGKLKKRIKSEYYYNKTYIYALPKKVSTYYAKPDGTVGQDSTYQFEYDDACNVTRIVDPYGTETRMAYANTSSDPNLCDFTAPTPVKIPVSTTTSTWTTSGDSNGYTLQTSAAANSGAVTKTATSTVTIGSLGGSISFNYCITGQLYSTNDWIYVLIDGKTVTSTSEYQGTPCSYTKSLSAGTHTIIWKFTRNSTASFATNCSLTNLIVTDTQTPTSQYQNYLFSSSISGYTKIGYNKLLTKATFIKDTIHTTSMLKQTHYKYDTAGNLIQISEAYNGSYINTYCTFDSYGNCLSQTDGNGNQICFEYTAEPYTSVPAVYLNKVKRANGTVIATYGDFDAALGNPLTVTDPKGNIFRYTYDAVGRMTQEKLDDPTVGICHNLEYHDDINKYPDDVNTVIMHYGQGNSWQVGRFTFDPIFGKLQKIERQITDLTTHQLAWYLIKENHFDTDGRVDWSLDGMEHKTQHVYDELNREIQTISPTNDSTYYAWDDKTLTVTDANNHTQTKTFDLLDRLIMVEDHPQSGITYPTTYIYDNYFDSQSKEPHSNLIQVVHIVNSRTIETTYKYNNLCQLVRVDHPQDGQNPLAPETYTYDNVGNLRTKTGVRGTKTIDYEFFASYRVSQITEPDGRIISNSYDDNDNLLSQTCPGAVYTYAYDAQNRVRNHSVQLDGNSFDFAYDYDVYGRMTSITYPGRTQPVTYHYDELDRLDYIPDFVSKCFYDGDSKLTKMELANGLKNTYHYDDDDRPDQIKAGNTGDLMNLAYAYDPVGNVKKINGDNYEYDGMNRLTWAGNLPSVQATTAWSRGTAWSYDAAGNMTGKADYSNGQLQQNTTFTYDSANRLWTMGSTTYGNDNAGARTAKNDGTNSWAYLYDGESRMTRATKNGSVIEDNIYDGSGMRVKKTLVKEDGTSQNTYYVYSGPNPVMEYSPSDGKYTYYIFSGAQSVAEESEGKKIFYHRDHLGSTRALTDQDRKLVGLCKYGAWGKLESTNEYDEGTVNGDFELTNENGQALSWVAMNDVPVVSDCSYAPVSGINGSAALKVARQGSSGNAYWSRQNLFVSPDTDYVLTGSFLSGNTQSTGAKAQLVYYDDHGNVLKIDDTGQLGYTGSWKAFTLNSHSPANAATMEIRLTEDSDQGMIAFFDGMRLKVPGLAGKYDFTGKKEDEGTGLSYFGARFYDSESCRLTTLDPSRDRLNWYEYCRDNPINLTDPDGQLSKPVMICIATAEVIGGAVTAVGGAALLTASSPTVVGIAVGAVVTVHGCNTLVSGVSDFASIFGGYSDIFGQVNVLNDGYKAVFGKKMGSIIYTCVDIAASWKGTATAFAKMVEMSKAVETSLYVYRGNWVDGFVRDCVKIAIDAPTWGERVAKGSIVCRDGLIYYQDASGTWSQLTQPKKLPPPKKSKGGGENGKGNGDGQK